MRDNLERWGHGQFGGMMAMGVFCKYAMLFDTAVENPEADAPPGKRVP